MPTFLVLLNLVYDTEGLNYPRQILREISISHLMVQVK